MFYDGSMPRMLMAALAALALSVPAVSAQAVLDPAREQQARQLETELIAPCCFTQWSRCSTVSWLAGRRLPPAGMLR